jgi:hypothetical protein
MITWGQLAKSQTDPEKIEEAIARMIAEHDADPEAHLCEGGSLKSHKMAEIIDHLVNSIIADKIKDFEVTPHKLAWTKLNIDCGFESLDGWSKFGPGTATLQLGSLALNSGLGQNKYVKLIAYGDVVGVNLGGKNPIFEAIVKFGSDTYQIAYFGAGADGGRFLGFKIIDGTLYACWAEDEEEYTQEIPNVDLTAFHTYRALAKNGDKIYFYVDEELKFSTDNIFRDEVGDIPVFTLYIQVTTESSRWMTLINLRFIQDR